MGCDYYKTSKLLILFKNGNQYTTTLGSERGYFPDYSGSDSDCEFNSTEYFNNLKRINQDKLLYNGEWIKNDYKNKFESYISEFKIEDISQILKVYSFSLR